MNFLTKLKGLANIGSLVKGILPSPWVLIAIGVAIVICSGVSAKIAYDTAFNKQQIEIDNIVNDRNKERSNWNSQVAKISIQSYDQMQQALALQVSRVNERSSIITKWKTRVVEKECGLSASGVAALNEMIGVGR